MYDTDNNIPLNFLTRPKSDEPFIEDDAPCWGDKEKQNDLHALINILNKSESILHECGDFIALDKPPDLRMDGTYRATVHKLSTYWYPSPLLQQQSNLLEAVECLHRHNYLKDNELRPIHQLDYPTSGVLLIGRNKRATAIASESFVKRTARKTYLAIVHGHMDVLQKDLPCFNNWRLKNALSQSEHNYKKVKDPKYAKKGDTFPGFVPAHTAFIKWQSAMKEKSKCKELGSSPKAEAINAMKMRRLEMKTKKGNVLEPKDFDQVIERSMSLSQEETNILMELKWKEVTVLNSTWKEAFESLAREYNRVLKIKHDSILYPPLDELPRLFRIKGEEEQQDAFYINAACAQIKERYKMLLLPESLVDDPSLIATKDQIQTLDFKPALTKCTILQRGYLQGNPVTKVSLSPLTGRRHQLRLHMVVAGSPIVGDKAYENKTDRRDICPRMCLHAHKLTLDMKGKYLNVVAPDPFVVVENAVCESRTDRLITFKVKIPGKEEYR
jgi:Pseudouridylate synthases, 23S RNA-specific